MVAIPTLRRSPDGACRFPRGGMEEVVARAKRLARPHLCLAVPGRRAPRPERPLLFPIASASIDCVADARRVILFDEFSFRPGGVSAVSVHGCHGGWPRPERPKLQAADPGLMGFILISNSLFFQINKRVRLR
ncbi:Os04g0371550 [Oryza sativa Japonica Group]|uniref:Uncharacterized protein n=2 Tax=Oryza sativa subsp. japonica TaxID=39947 RepID=A0A8J8YPU8_ORYSJ|nr:hypothetical protein OsJ_14469 [Oryza sativa Japonica Group]BAS88822.1 Os04g0371550 [Oryza sativa Japonica Group]